MADVINGRIVADWQKVYQAVAETVVPATSTQPPVPSPAAPEYQPSPTP